ncbi:MAG: fumarate hydratase [Candidatus Cloacimonetes bacterium HGW-Cloacimonetes-3]|nr:MAG: fumarate hydratase [Candidatus Cloacimonetes bacterium HGW-Cloacimonetes-3]
MQIHRIELPLKPSDKALLRVGDKVLLSGEIFTARDAAHARLERLMITAQPLPFDLSETSLFYCGPSPKPEGKVCGAIGPTTSTRMDRYTPLLIDHGLRVMIGKGERSSTVKQSILSHHAVYMVCVGGVSALMAQSIVSCETYAWGELGAEAIYRLVVKDLPAYIAII